MAIKNLDEIDYIRMYIHRQPRATRAVRTKVNSGAGVKHEDITITRSSIEKWRKRFPEHVTINYPEITVYIRPTYLSTIRTIQYVNNTRWKRLEMTCFSGHVTSDLVISMRPKMSRADAEKELFAVAKENLAHLLNGVQEDRCAQVLASLERDIMYGIM